jgi:hypothetical protein
MKLRPHAELHATGQNGENFPSKAALRRALADAPGFVVWRDIAGPTEGFRDRFLTTPELIEAIDGSALVIGPIPEVTRSYYGTVTVKDGKVKVA